MYLVASIPTFNVPRDRNHRIYYNYYISQFPNYALIVKVIFCEVPK